LALDKPQELPEPQELSIPAWPQRGSEQNNRAEQSTSSEREDSNKEASGAEDFGEVAIPKKPPTLSFVQAAAKDINAVARKNVYKSIIRQLLKNYARDPKSYFDYIQTYMTLSKERLNWLQDMIRNLGVQEKGYNSDIFPKDYVKLINRLSDHSDTLLLLLKCLNDILARYSEGHFGQISQKSQPIYKKVIEGLRDMCQCRLKDFGL
jgi:hypothetical protein